MAFGADLGRVEMRGADTGYCSARSENRFALCRVAGGYGEERLGFVKVGEGGDGDGRMWHGK